ncbi:hypothetical protein F503_05211 [Ophiostoma piceae UAMH 11346]|uniref:Duf3433 domain protein n=1 Tax=Ophiostoma piceae (strain UAMH 11346) TaxID=1262450 RepID=S3CDM5_OPHP1|nr:hypothetical protein F503_05211 [Ophiostoma piceae UAMH 11346]
MDPYGANWKPGQVPPTASSSSIPSSGSATPAARVTPSDSESRLSHNISSFTDFSQFDSFDAYQSAAVLQHSDDDDDEPEQHASASASASATIPSAYDPQPQLRGRASMVSLDSLVYDETLGAYTKAVVTAATSPGIPSTTYATAPATTSASIFTPSPTISTPESTPHTPFSSISTPSSLRTSYQPSTTQAETEGGRSAAAPASEPAPYSTYDSSYGSNSTSYFPGGSGSSSATKPTLGRRLSNMLSSRRRGSHLGSQPYGTIQEDEPYDGSRESIDMASLVQNAAPIAQEPSGSSKSYSRIDEHDAEDSAGGADVPVDLTSLSGPSTGQDELLLENHRKLARGLGPGFGPSIRLRESELLDGASASSNNTPISPIASLARTFSRRWTSLSPASSPLSPTTGSGLPFGRRDMLRQNTVRALAQNEANRRGEIVEVIIEEEDGNGENGGLSDNTRKSDDDAVGNGGLHVDLSVMSGTEGPESLASSRLSMAERRQSRIPRSTTQVFYPQPNWRPFSMRWPYLSALILLSIGLGVGQEFIYRMSLHKPLIKFHSPSEIHGMLYFAVKFAPTIIAVTFGILWQVTDFEVKRLEAFYQLSKEGGAVADESINVDYVTYIAFLRPFRALHCKHYAVAVSSVVSLLAVSLVPTLSAASIVLTPDRETRIGDPRGEKSIVISAVWSRILTSVFFVVAVLGILLFWLLHRRRSGLLSDVRGIAGLASMAVVSHILTDFNGMDLASHQDIHKQLEERRYVLRNSSLAPDDDNPVSLAERERYKVFDSHMSQNPHPLMLRAGGCVPYICGVVLFAMLIPVVLFTPANALTDKASWVLTAIAVSIKLGWGGLETAVRVMEPYYILWRRHAPAKTLTLDYTAMPFVFVAWQALMNRHMLVFFVGFATILTELLTVLVTSLATVEGHNFIGENLHEITDGDAESGEETALTFWVTLGLAIFILAYMSIVATVVFIRRRRPFLPRQPNTIASVLAYIHQSKMLLNFENTSKMSSREMLAELEKAGDKYGLGWFVGLDNKTHCGIDQEELLSNFKLGYDYTRSNKPWQENVEGWL